jgi:capsular exopolysaccharide synthesis family protein
MVLRMTERSSEGRRGDQPGEQPLEVRRYLNALKRSWPLVVLLVVLVTAAAVGVTSLAEKKYRATATVVQGTTLLSDSSNVDATTRQLATIQRLLKTSPILDRALTHLPGQTRGSLGSAISSSVDPDANIINITAENKDPHAVASIANAVAGALIKTHTEAEARGLETARSKLLIQLARLRSSGAPVEELQAVRDRISELVIAQASIGNDLRFAQAATPPLSSFTPRPVRNGVVAFFAATFLLILIVIGRDLLRPRVLDPRELARLMGLPVLARVPLAESRFGRQATTQLVAEEAYQTLQASISYAHRESGKIILVTSALEKEGKTTTAIGLAKALARAGEKTLLICADFRLPTLHERLGIKRSPGFSDMLHKAHHGSKDVLMAADQTIRRVGSGSGAGTLDVIPSGSRVGNPAELLFGGSLAVVLEALATLKHDHVIIDGPPMLAIADAHGLAEKADSLLLVSRPDRLTVEQALETRERLTWLHTNVLGLVVCGRFRTDHAYGYLYAQESGAPVLAHGAQENGASEPRRISETRPRRQGASRPPR